MEEKIISVKDYSKARNRSLQGVYQQMKRPANAELLKDHIILKTVGNREVKFLDEYAVDVLDQGRNNNPAVVIRTEQDERIEELEQINHNQLLKIAEQANQIAEQAKELLETKTLLLESSAKTEEEKKKREEAEEKEKALQEQIQQKNGEADQLRQQLNTLQEQLQAEKGRKLSLSERLFGRKKDKN